MEPPSRTPAFSRSNTRATSPSGRPATLAMSPKVVSSFCRPWTVLVPWSKSWMILPAWETSPSLNCVRSAKDWKSLSCSVALPKEPDNTANCRFMSSSREAACTDWLSRSKAPRRLTTPAASAAAWVASWAILAVICSEAVPAEPKLAPKPPAICLPACSASWAARAIFRMAALARAEPLSAPLGSTTIWRVAEVAMEPTVAHLSKKMQAI